MTIQVIFAPVSGKESDTFVLAAGRAIAQRFNAHIDVALLCPDPRSAIPYLGEAISGEVVEQLIAQAEADNTKLTSRARTGFEEWRDAAGMVMANTLSDRVAIAESEDAMPSCSWSEFVGAPESPVTSMGRLADLIIAPRGDIAQELENEMTFEAALLRSGRPLLMVPSEARKTIGNRIVVAWDGSLEATRALGAAMPFLRTAESVTVVTIAEEGKGGPSVEGLSGYLSWHGIQANTKSVEPEKLSIGEAIYSAALGEASDLLVMGAYSHNRYRELIFGGATRYILDKCSLPVLLSH